MEKSIDSASVVSYDVPSNLSRNNNRNGFYVNVNTTTAAVDINLPEISGIDHDDIDIIVNDAGNNAATNNITVNFGGSDKCDGKASFVIKTDGQSNRFSKSGSTTWDTEADSGDTAAEIAADAADAQAIADAAAAADGWIEDQVILNSAAIKALGFSDIIAAPGANKAICLDYIDVRAVHATTAYTYPDAVFDLSMGGNYSYLDASMLTVLADQFVRMRSFGSTRFDNSGVDDNAYKGYIANQPLQFAIHALTSPTLGDGSLVFDVRYKIVDVTVPVA